MAAGYTHGDTLRVVLLGKTGSGKSTLGNALTGLKAPKSTPGEKRDEIPPGMKDPNEGFKVGRGLSSMTKFCDWTRALRMGAIVEVTDTPGLCDTELPEEQIYKEVAKSVAVAKPGPHVIIFVVRIDKRFTWEEKSAYDSIKQLFSEEMNKHLILVFNGLDTFKDDADSIEEQRRLMTENIRQFGEPLTSMVKAAGGRIFGMNNEVSPKEKEKQAYELINMMKELVRQNGHTYYRTEMTEQINQKVEELTNAEANAKHVPKAQARDTVNEAIIAEKVKPGFWTSVTDTVRCTAQNIGEGLQKICAVM